jgi:hypothetical protein
MRPSTLLLLSLAGTRTDRLRTVLTAASSALAAVALLAAATVASIRGGDWVDQPDGSAIRAPGSEQYASPLLAEAGLRPGVITALVLLALPVLALAGQCIRLGAPARDRRLAAIRLAGATPRQAVLVGGAETAVASALGSLLGFGVFLLLRVLLERRTADGRLALPTDILPAPGLIALCLLLVPLLAAAVGTLLLRRVIITPIGVVRRARDRKPLPWPGVLILAGLALFAVPGQMDRALNDTVLLLCLAGGVSLTMIGVVLGTGWISYTTGRLLVRTGRRPAMLLAGRRLMEDPWNGSRTLAALLAAVVAGAIAIGYRQYMITEFAGYDRIDALTAAGDDSGPGVAEEPGFYLGAIRLILLAVLIGLIAAAAGVLVALAEGIVARRRAYAALTAVGVPRKVLSESVVWHTFAPLVPAVAIALASGVGIARLVGTEVRMQDGSSVCRGTETQCAADPMTFTEFVVQHEVVLAVPVPWAGLLLLGATALVAMLVAVGAGLLVLRSSTDLEELRAG